MESKLDTELWTLKEVAAYLRVSAACARPAKPQSRIPTMTLMTGAFIVIPQLTLALPCLSSPY